MNFIRANIPDKEIDNKILHKDRQTLTNNALI
jgi:hypothetical protein